MEPLSTDANTSFPTQLGSVQSCVTSNSDTSDHGRWSSNMEDTPCLCWDVRRLDGIWKRKKKLFRWYKEIWLNNKKNGVMNYTKGNCKFENSPWTASLKNWAFISDSKWLKDLNIRHDTIKLEKSIGKTFSNIIGIMIFLRSASQDDINKQMGQNQTYKLLYSKGSHKRKTTYGTGENICKWCDKGLIPKYTNRSYSSTEKQPNQTLGRRPQ